MNNSKDWPQNGSRLMISRRRLMQAGAALAGASFLSIDPSRLVAATFEEVGSQWTSADIDWKSQAGKTIVLNAVQHPWTDAITPLVPLFTELTGIEVEIQTQSETEYTAELPVKLGARNPTPDVYMVWAIGQADHGRLAGDAGRVLRQQRTQRRILVGWRRSVPVGTLVPAVVGRQSLPDADHG